MASWEDSLARNQGIGRVALLGVTRLVRLSSRSGFAVFLAVVVLNVLGLASRVAMMATLILPIQVVVWAQAPEPREFLGRTFTFEQQILIGFAMTVASVILHALLAAVFDNLFRAVLNAGTRWFKTSLSRRHLSILLDFWFVIIALALIATFSLASAGVVATIVAIVFLVVFQAAHRSPAFGRARLMQIANIWFGIGFVVFASFELWVTLIGPSDGLNLLVIAIILFAARLGIQRASRAPLRLSRANDGEKQD